MRWFFFSFTEQTDQKLVLWKITPIFSKLWRSTEVEPYSGLMAPSLAAGGCLVYFGLLFIPSCSCRHSPVGRTAGSTRLFLCYSWSWMCSEPVHQLPIYSSCSLRRPCGFRNWCNQLLNSATAVAVGVPAGEVVQEKQNPAAAPSCRVLPWPFW